ncbi:hypothetical protein PUN28_000954 [Cardiocondyla obscurior]|uniref:Uncharacterized protein n=1 Tax=Cardiocondyla obscurior TaxID=286306 RepID=A0AAW2H1X4_9HYME
MIRAKVVPFLIIATSFKHTTYGKRELFVLHENLSLRTPPENKRERERERKKKEKIMRANNTLWSAYRCSSLINAARRRGSFSAPVVKIDRKVDRPPPRHQSGTGNLLLVSITRSSIANVNGSHFQLLSLKSPQDLRSCNATVFETFIIILRRLLKFQNRSL